MGTTEGLGEREPTITDGRLIRSLRTRANIVHSALALIREGDYKPSAPRIAERAGISVRSVYQHFDDLDKLFIEVTESAFAVSELDHPEVDRSLPVPERVGLFVTQRAQRLETITPIRRAALTQGTPPLGMVKLLLGDHAEHKQEVLDVFAAELRGHPYGYDAAANLACTVTGWHHWEMQRTFEDRSASETQMIVEGALLRLLS